MSRKNKTFILHDRSYFNNLLAFLNSTVAQWIEEGRPALIVTIERYVKGRTLPQNSRMWALLTELAASDVVCPGTDTRLSKEGWHEYLRVELGFVSGTRLVPLGNGRMVETPNPQATAKGEPDQMTVEEHSDYMIQIEQFMAENYLWSNAA